MVRESRVKQYGTGTLTASAGSATANSSPTTHNGQLLGIYTNLMSASCTTVNVTCGGRTVYNKGVTSDSYHGVLAQAYNTSGTAITNQGVPVPLNGILTVTCSGTSPVTGTVAVTVFYI